jgi:hypothetical protein
MLLYGQYLRKYKACFPLIVHYGVCSMTGFTAVICMCVCVCMQWGMRIAKNALGTCVNLYTLVPSVPGSPSCFRANGKHELESSEVTVCVKSLRLAHIRKFSGILLFFFHRPHFPLVVINVSVWRFLRPNVMYIIFIRKSDSVNCWHPSQGGRELFV